MAAFRGFTAPIRGADELMKTPRTPFPQGTLIDQGLADQFLAAQPLPHRFDGGSGRIGRGG